METREIIGIKGFMNRNPNSSQRSMRCQSIQELLEPYRKLIERQQQNEFKSQSL